MRPHPDYDWREGKTRNVTSASAQTGFFLVQKSKAWQPERRQPLQPHNHMRASQGNEGVTSPGAMRDYDPKPPK